MIQLTEKAIDVSAVIQSVENPAAGAVVLFLGTARDMTDQQPVESLEYEAYPEMAERKLADLENQARRLWELVDCAIVHRLGAVPIGQTCVAIAVSSAHRKEAFEAGRWLIDQIKEVVPIWKKEHLTDGSGRWGKTERKAESGKPKAER